MKIIISIFLIASVIFNLSCKNLESSDITIIDGIRLGTKTNNLYSQLDSLKIPTKNFYSNYMYNSIEEIKNNKIKAYTTDIFNFSEYSTPLTKHYGVYYPIENTGTKNIIGMKVLLVHTSPARIYSKSGITDLTQSTGNFALDQNVNTNLVNQILSMLSTKYGKPNDTLRMEHMKLYVVKGDQILERYHPDSANIGEMIIWKKKYLTISFFTGILSFNNVFNFRNHTYSIYFDSDPLRKIDTESGEVSCKSYAYISYELTDIAIEEMGLDKLSL